jgi:soluble lytic murein transglycosylase-like protein
MVSRLAQFGDIQDATQLIPALQRDQAGNTVSQALGGGPQGAPPPQARMPAPQPPPPSAPPQAAPIGGLAGSILGMVSSVLPGGGDTVQRVASNIGRALGVAPDAPLPPDKAAQAQRLVGSYAERNGLNAMNERAAKIAPLAQAAGAKYGVSPDLLQRQMWQESRFDPNARSKAGAIGISQFMPETAREEGVNPRDVASSIDGQARLMKKLLTRYGGNEGLALAAYNWDTGGQKMQRWLDSGADPRRMPKETRTMWHRSADSRLRRGRVDGRSRHHGRRNQHNRNPRSRRHSRSLHSALPAPAAVVLAD